MARRQLDALWRHQVDQRVVVEHRRRGVMNSVYHLLILLGTGHREHALVYVADRAFFDAHAAGDDHLAVFGQGFADHFQRFSLGGIDEAAGVDHNDVSVLVGGDDFVAFHAQLGEDALRIDQGFGATQGNEANLWGGRRGDDGHGEPRYWVGARANGRGAFWALGAPLIKKCAILAAGPSIDQLYAENYDEC